MWDKIAQSINNEIDKSGIRSLFYDFENDGGEGCSEKNFQLMASRHAEVLCFLDQLDLRGYADFFVEMLSGHMTHAFLRVNQYLAANQKTLQDTRILYKQFLSDIRQLCAADALSRAAADSVFVGHYTRLQSFLDNYNGERMPTNYTGIDAFPKRLVEYNPLFQIDMLGISMEQIVAPVIDIGCGKKAELVKLLRERGIEAYGIDKNVIAEDYLIRADYMAYAFAPGTYGTVISHMAFSNELWYLKERGSIQLSRYKRKYYEILESLKPDGCFIYTPGLPFLEKGLSGYNVQCGQVAQGTEKQYTATVKRSYPY